MLIIIFFLIYFIFIIYFNEKSQLLYTYVYFIKYMCMLHKVKYNINDKILLYKI